MTDVPFPHRVFVDFENCQDIELSLVRGKPVHVTLLIGKTQSRLPTELALSLHELGAQVQPIRLGDSGRNALDLTLAFYLGQATRRWPEAEFHIVSKDHDYDPMLRHLATLGVRASRSEAFSSLAFLKAPKAPARSRAPKPKTVTAPADPADERCARIIARLTDPSSQNRPSTETRLRAHIKASLGKHASGATVEKVLRTLVEKRVLALRDEGRVEYSATP